MEKGHPDLSVRKQCELFFLKRSSLYYQCLGLSEQDHQFTSRDFTSLLKSAGIKISMDGKGRVIDNIFIERFWRTLKYEEVYTKAYDSVWECKKSIGTFIKKYNALRLHQSLGIYDTPLEAYRQMQMSAAC